jgi:hypothetical protein
MTQDPEALEWKSLTIFVKKGRNQNPFAAFTHFGLLRSGGMHRHGHAAAPERLRQPV